MLIKEQSTSFIIQENKNRARFETTTVYVIL